MAAMDEAMANCASYDTVYWENGKDGLVLRKGMFMTRNFKRLSWHSAIQSAKG